MPTFARPSTKAVLVAGAIAMTLVVGAASGAVAGKMITSRQIKDETIKSRDIRNNAVKNQDIGRGAVSWEKSLDHATKDLIEALVQPGPPGEQGPAGSPGPPGATGAPGGGLVGSGVYGPTYVDGVDFTVIDDGTGPGTREIYSQLGDDIVLPGPGTYLISVQAAYLVPGSLFFDDPGAGGLDLTTDPDAILRFFMRSCSGFMAPMCQISIPYVVPAGSPASVPLRVFALGDGSCGCDEFPLQATVNVFQMDRDDFALKVARSPRLRGHEARELADELVKLRDQGTR